MLKYWWCAFQKNEVTIAIAFSVFSVLVCAVLFFKPSSGELASWVQAVGSIAGIFTAVAIGVHQTRSSSRQRNLEAQNKRKSCMAVVKFAAHQGQAASNYLESLGALWPYVSSWEEKLSLVNKFSLDSLSAIPMHELGSDLAVLAYSEIYTNLVIIREESIGLVADIRASNRDNSSRTNAIYMAAVQLKGSLLNFELHYKINVADFA